MCFQLIQFICRILPDWALRYSPKSRIIAGLFLNTKPTFSDLPKQGTFWGRKENLSQAEFTYFLFVLLRIASAPVHSSSGCMYQLHSVCTANRTSWKPAQEICMCTKPGVVRVCCTGLCKLMVPHGAPTECPHVFLLGELRALVRKTAGGTWSTCMGIYFRFIYLDLA